MPLNGAGYCGAMSKSLTVIVPNRQWSITITRIDWNSDGVFASYHQQPVSEANIKVLIPNWQNLNWTHHSASLPGHPHESRADDPPYRISLDYYFSASSPQPAQYVAEFLADLA